MHGDLLTLARQLAAHPKWPHHRPAGQLRDRHGIQWVWSDREDWEAGGSGIPVPNLRDAAAAGVLLEMLDKSTPKAVHVSSVADGWEISVGVAFQFGCSCLGEAAARALLACWGAE